MTKPLLKVMRSGRLVNLLEFDPTKDFDWGDAVAGLSVPRFGNQTWRPYYVTQHSVILHDWFAGRGDSKGAKVAIVHDIAEAYVGDLHAGIKRRQPDLVALDAMITGRIFQHLGIRKDRLVEEADRLLCSTELAYFWPDREWPEGLRGAAVGAAWDVATAAWAFQDARKEYWE